MSDELELRLIQESAVDSSKEIEARKSLLKRLYAEIERGWRQRAPNGGLLIELPDCVKSGEPCPDDMIFSYNAIRVLMSRYMTKNELGLFAETPSMVMRRVAEGIGVEVERVYRMLVEGRFMFNSPTLFNMYADGARGTLSACYVTPVYDSMREIMDAGVVQAMTFKYGGGQGFSFSELRPRWDAVKGTSSFSSGPMSFMRLYDIITELVKQGGKRRGANMGIMHAWHPDIYTPGFDPYVALKNALPIQIANVLEATRRLIEEIEREGYEVDKGLKGFLDNLLKDGWWSTEDAGFIQAKEPPLQDANLTNFNISVGANDAFMKAILEDDYWWMVNPKYSERSGVYSLHYSVSKAYGLGILGELIERHPWLLDNPYFNIFEDVLERAKSKALSEYKASMEARGWQASEDFKNSYAWRIRARELWEKIVENAWGGGDPGLVFFDNHNKHIATPWLGLQNATNPCSEQVLYPFENCNLGSFSLEKYVSERFDVERFYEDVVTITDAMDREIDVNNHPDERHFKVNLMTRKIGIGFMGLADALAKLGYPYDSEEAVAFTMIVSAMIEAFSWKRSWELGATLGHAPAFDCRRYDWKAFRCVEQGNPEELAELLVPALVKASRVMRREDGWIKVRYHEGLELPDYVTSKLKGLMAERVEHDGSLRLLREETLAKVLKEAFGIDEEHIERALSEPMKAVHDPRLLTALALFAPDVAWNAIKAYGRSLGAKAPRNTVTTTVAPTGTISIIAGTSSGIEPYFALVFKRQVAVGTFLEINKMFREDLLRIGYSREELEKIYDAIRMSKGSLRWALSKLAWLGDRIKPLEELARKYATAMDFELWYHIAHQAAAQLFIDQAISKTINLPRDAPKEDVFASYFVAWLAGLKGVTVYRDESKGKQVIVFGGENQGEQKSLLRKKSNNLRMATFRRTLNTEEVKKDTKLTELFEVENEEVVMKITENSTCKTCER